MPATPSSHSKRWWQFLLLYFHTLRYLRPSQVVYKPVFMAKYFLFNRHPQMWGKIYSCRFGSDPRSPDLNNMHFLRGLREQNSYPPFRDNAWNLRQAEKLLQDEFHFLNRSHRFNGTIDWEYRGINLLWCYQLHYFNYAWNLGVAYLENNDRKFYQKFKTIVESWIEQNRLGKLDGWHPYTISLRAVNWIYAYEMFQSEMMQDDKFLHKFLRSLYTQLDFLFHNLEYQGYGNHLLANIKALIFGGLFFKGIIPERWLRTGVRLLHQEIDEQILEDGGHFERSPMYHLIVMKDLMECFIALRNEGQPDYPCLKRAIGDMADFAEGIRQPDGRLPLLNDSAYDLMPNPKELIGMARNICENENISEAQSFSTLLLGHVKTGLEQIPKHDKSRSVALKDSGYFVMRGNGSFLILDCGPVCPDYLPPHGHADTLSYEFWLNGVRMITDSGVYEYTAGEWRDFFRSTRAHNTVVIDGGDQSEVWGSFRVARRAYPRDLIWITTDEMDYFSGGHDGYQRLAEPTFHHRRVLGLKDKFWVILDRISGRGIHRADSFIHFHPDVSVDLSTPGQLSVSCNQQKMTVFAFDYDKIGFFSGQVDPVQGWYSPEFGLKQSRQTFCLTRVCPTPFFVGYILASGEVSQAEVFYELEEAAERYTVRIDDSRWLIDISINESNLRVKEQAA